jgi:hypothetical protein
MHARPLIRTFAASAVVAALAVSGAAVAQTYTHQDAKHDVQRYLLSSGKIENVPHNKATDIVRARLSYSKDGLTSTVWLRSGKVGDSWLMSGPVHTGSTHFDWSASQDPSGKVLELRDAHGASVACDGLDVRVAHRKGRVAMTVPTSCLGTPDWVKAGVAFSVQPSDTTLLIDDGLQKRGLTKEPTFSLSPKLHRLR